MTTSWAKARAKYGAVRTSCGKHSHASGGESDYCCELQLRERVGDITIVQSQPNVFLTEARIRVIPDWLIVDHGKNDAEVYVDFKGFEGASWRRNRKLWMHYGPATLLVVKRRGTRFFVSETIIPEKLKTVG